MVSAIAAALIFSFYQGGFADDSYVTGWFGDVGSGYHMRYSGSTYIQPFEQDGDVFQIAYGDDSSTSRFGILYDGHSATIPTERMHCSILDESCPVQLTYISSQTIGEDGYFRTRWNGGLMGWVAFSMLRCADLDPVLGENTCGEIEVSDGPNPDPWGGDLITGLTTTTELVQIWRVQEPSMLWFELAALAGLFLLRKKL